MSVPARRLDYWAARRPWPWLFAAFWFGLGALSMVFFSDGTLKWIWTAGSWLVSLVWMWLGLAVERHVRLGERATP